MVDIPAEAHSAPVLPEQFKQPQPDAYREAGIAFRSTYYGYEAAAERDEVFITNPDGFPDSPEEYYARIQPMEDAGWLDARERQTLVKLQEYLTDNPINAELTIGNVRSYFQRFRDQVNLSPATTPFVYHALGILEASLFETQVDILVDNFSKKAPSLAKRGDDGKLCDVYGSLCPAGSNADARLSSAVRAAVAATAAAAFKDAVEITIANNFIGFIGNIDLGNLTEQVLATIVAQVVILIWNEVFCKEQCDECYPAFGIDAVFEDCDFAGIRARGFFEFAERWEWRFDFNNDGVFGGEIQTRENFVPLSSLPSQPFSVIVDVICDDRLPYFWSGEDDDGTITGVLIDPNMTPADLPRPVAIVDTPPSSSNFFHRPNTRLCFTASSSVSTGGGWRFKEWRAAGGSPSTSSSSGGICTRFNDTSPQWRFVEMVFTHPCVGDHIAGGSDVYICPPGSPGCD
jgi:hypothetical protein